ncbi:MAG: tryptophan synthase subunit alpha, partial [Pseudomonadota bacterium]
GFLVVDLPPEEAGDFKKAAESCGLAMIFLLAPTSTDERMKLVSKAASGFIYYVSVTGVTGARETLAEMMDSSVEKIRKFSSLPVGVGFGVSTPEHVTTIAHYADAVIVGSAIIKVIAEHRGSPDMIQKTGHYIRSLKDATHVIRSH